MPSQADKRSRGRRGRLKAPNIPTALDNLVSSSSPHPPEVAPVFNTMTRIWAASAVIDSIRRDMEENSIPAATLDRVSPLSKLLWEEILLLLPSTIPSLQSSLTTYELILVDIQQILSSNDPLRVSDDTIDRQLDDFMVQFQKALEPLKISQRVSPNSTHFFQNSHHILISGGNFSSNPVVQDPVLREQSHNILRVLYIQCGVLFGSAVSSMVGRSIVYLRR
ncbi:hypothetical protein BYT27DRAFT_7191416 [Phlegmacium glaucopus]|nr:hypothetical protein BYT27DRAFT_7191416 [Phlegmacium glaucopus]